MTTLISGNVARTISADTFVDIVGACTVDMTPNGDTVIVFSGDLTSAQVNAVLARLRTPVNEELLDKMARDLYVDLRTIRNSSGTLPAADLSKAVRALAKAQIAVIRLLLRDLDGID